MISPDLPVGSFMFPDRRPQARLYVFPDLQIVVPGIKDMRFQTKKHKKHHSKDVARTGERDRAAVMPSSPLTPSLLTPL